MTTEIDLKQKTVARREREGGRRRAEILSAARKILAEKGIIAFSMLRLAKVAGYSRPTVYRYFPTKADVILSLYVEFSALRYLLIKRVETFDGRPRERLVAITEINAIVFPHIYSLGFVAPANVADRATPELNQRITEAKKAFGGVTMRVFEEALASGDLVLPSALSREEVGALLKGTVTGALGASGSRHAMADIDHADLKDPIGSMRRMVRMLLDALAWRPLSTEWDYDATMKRIYEEVFPPELLWEVRKLGEPRDFELDL